MIARVLALAILVAAPIVARADDETDRAKAADRSARRHFDLREYAAAIEDYRRAFEALPDPLFLFDIAQAYRQMNDCPNAAAFYRNYLRDKPAADNRAMVEQLIAEMDACPKPDPTIIVLTPPAPPPRHPRLRLAGIITGVAGLAVIGTGVYFSFDAGNQANKIELACATGCVGSTVAGIDRDGKAANRYAIAAYAIGGGAAASGIAMLVWSLVDAGGEAPIVSPTAGGVAISMRQRF